MTKQLTAMIDMDDVIVSGGYLYLINEFLGTHYTEADFDGKYYMQSVIPDKYMKEFYEFLFKRNMYNYCTINPDAYEVMERLNKLVKLRIGTAYIFKEVIRESGIILSQKYNFLMESFPYFSHENFVFLTDKSVLNAEIRMDDRMDNLEGAETKILFTAYHNKNISNEILEKNRIERADNWLEAEKIIVKKIDGCYNRY